MAGLLLIATAVPEAFALDEEERGEWQTIGMGKLKDGWFLKGQYELDVEIQQNVANENRFRIWKPYANLQAKTGVQNTSTYLGQIVFDIEDPTCVLIEPGIPAGFTNSDTYVMGMTPGTEYYCTNDFGYVFNLMGKSTPKETAKGYITMIGGQKSTYDKAEGVVYIPRSVVSDPDGQINSPTGTPTYIYMPAEFLNGKEVNWTFACSEDAFDFTLNGKPASATYSNGSYYFEKVEKEAELTATLKDQYSLYKITGVAVDPDDVAEVEFEEKSFTVAQGDYDGEYTFNVTIAPVSETPFVTLADEDFVVNPGESTVITLEIANPTLTPFKGFQAALTLPEGLSVTAAEAGQAVSGFTAKFNNTADGAFVAIISENASTARVGELLKITLTAADDALPTKGNVEINGMLFASKGGSDIDVEVEFDLGAEIFVEPTSLTISAVSMEGVENKTELKETESLELTATLNPAVVTFPNVLWSVDETDAVELVYPEDNTDGHNVTLVVKENVAPVTVTITATFENKPEIKDEYVVTISRILLGDANDNGRVTISDAVAISNDILCQGTDESLNDTFCFVNADVNADKTIDVVDQAATINIALGAEPFPAKDKAAKAQAIDASDRMRANVMTGDNNEVEIEVYFENPASYIAMQADITIPAGMEVVEVARGAQASRHALAWKLNGGNMRVNTYSVDNNTYNTAGSPLFTIKAIASEENTGISLNNIIAVDANVGRHNLDSYVTFNEAAGVADAAVAGVSVYGSNGEIVVAGGEGLAFSVFAIDGKLVKSFVAGSADARVSVAGGVYTVVCGDKAFKVAVK